MPAKIRFGAIAGTATVVLFLLFYWIDRPLVNHPALWWGSMILYLVFMYRAVKSAAPGDFRSALQPAFLTFVVANALFYLFYYLLFGVFDPGLVDLQRETMVSDPRFGQAFENYDLKVTLGNTFFRYCYSLIGGFILSLGVAAAGRR
ncbi:MAG: DUF4199 family protein [Lewinellaceae bacterium]|nr:DUF4199 family protein [Lewinella sp.]MCB9278276.1 DUF4199 family protein [Lewinellaceae bacterium]